LFAELVRRLYNYRIRAINILDFAAAIARLYVSFNIYCCDRLFVWLFFLLICCISEILEIVFSVIVNTWCDWSSCYIVWLQ